MTQNTGGQNPGERVGENAAPKQYQEAMPKLELAPNTRVLVKLSSLNNNSVPLQGEFLGTLHYEFLILRLPSIPGLIKKLFPHTLVEISFQHEGTTNSFSSEILSHTVRPALLLYTSYPDRMNVLETRKHERVTSSLPISLATPYGEAVAVMKDLSRGGCCAVLELTGQSAMRQIASGDRIVLQAPFSATVEAARGIGLVRNVESSGTRLLVGLSFDGNSKDFLSALHAYLELVQLFID